MVNYNDKDFGKQLKQKFPEVSKSIDAESRKRTKNINSAAAANAAESRKRAKNINSVATAASQIPKQNKNIYVKESYKESKRLEKIYGGLESTVKNLAKTSLYLAKGTRDLTLETARGVKNITVGSAKAMKDSIAEYGRQVGKDININSHNFMVMALGKITPLVGYFTAKLFETKVFSGMISKLKESLGSALSAIGRRFKDLVLGGWERLKGVFSRSDAVEMSKKRKKISKKESKKMKPLSEVPHLQKGGMVTKSGIVKVHAGEVVASADEIVKGIADRIDQQIAAKSGGMGGMNSPDQKMFFKKATKRLTSVFDLITRNLTGLEHRISTQEEAMLGKKRGVIGTFIDSYMKAADPNAHLEIAEHQLRVLLEMKESWKIETNLWRHAWEETLLHHPTFRTLVLMAKGLKGFGRLITSPLRYLFKARKTKGYVNDLATGKNVFENIQNNIGKLYVGTMYRLDQVIENTKKSAQASTDMSKRITGKSYGEIEDKMKGPETYTKFGRLIGKFKRKKKVEAISQDELLGALEGNESFYSKVKAQRKGQVVAKLPEDIMKFRGADSYYARMCAGGGITIPFGGFGGGTGGGPEGPEGPRGEGRRLSKKQITDEQRKLLEDILFKVMEERDKKFWPKLFGKLDVSSTWEHKGKRKRRKLEDTVEKIDKAREKRKRRFATLKDLKDFATTPAEKKEINKHLEKVARESAYSTLKLKKVSFKLSKIDETNKLLRDQRKLNVGFAKRWKQRISLAIKQKREMIDFNKNQKKQYRRLGKIRTTLRRGFKKIKGLKGSLLSAAAFIWTMLKTPLMWLKNLKFLGTIAGFFGKIPGAGLVKFLGSQAWRGTKYAGGLVKGLVKGGANIIKGGAKGLAKSAPGNLVKHLGKQAGKGAKYAGGLAKSLFKAPGKLGAKLATKLPTLGHAGQVAKAGASKVGSFLSKAATPLMALGGTAYGAMKAQKEYGDTIGEKLSWAQKIGLGTNKALKFLTFDVLDAEKITGADDARAAVMESKNKLDKQEKSFIEKMRTSMSEKAFELLGDNPKGSASRFMALRKSGGIIPREGKWYAPEDIAKVDNPSLKQKAKDIYNEQFGQAVPESKPTVSYRTKVPKPNVPPMTGSKGTITIIPSQNINTGEYASPAEQALSPWTAGIPHMATGGQVDKTGLAKVHKGEVILPHDEVLNEWMSGNRKGAKVKKPFKASEFYKQQKSLVSNYWGEKGAGRSTLSSQKKLVTEFWKEQYSSSKESGKVWAGSLSPEVQSLVKLGSQNWEANLKAARDAGSVLWHNGKLVTEAEYQKLTGSKFVTDLKNKADKAKEKGKKGYDKNLSGFENLKNALLPYKAKRGAQVQKRNDIAAMQGMKPKDQQLYMSGRIIEMWEDRGKTNRIRHLAALEAIKWVDEFRADKVRIDDLARSFAIIHDNTCENVVKKLIDSPTRDWFKIVTDPASCINEPKGKPKPKPAPIKHLKAKVPPKPKNLPEAAKGATPKFSKVSVKMMGQGIPFTDKMYQKFIKYQQTMSRGEAIEKVLSENKPFVQNYLQAKENAIERFEAKGDLRADMHGEMEAIKKVYSGALDNTAKPSIGKEKLAMVKTGADILKQKSISALTKAQEKTSKALEKTGEFTGKMAQATQNFIDASTQIINSSQQNNGGGQAGGSSPVSPEVSQVLTNTDL